MGKAANMKGENLLIIGGLGLGAYLMFPSLIQQLQSLATGQSGGGGGTSVSLPSISIPGISSGNGGGLGLGDLSGLIEKLVSAPAQVITDPAKAVQDFIAAQEAKGLKYMGGGLWGAVTGAIPDVPNIPDLASWEKTIMDRVNQLLNPKPESNTNPNTAPNKGADQYTSENEPNYDIWGAARQKGATEVTALGGILASAKILPLFANLAMRISPRLAETILPKVAAGISGVGMPVAVAWTAADVLTTVYEFLSGKNVAGGWLGWREIFYPETNTKAQVPSKGIGSPTPYAVTGNVGSESIGYEMKNNKWVPTEPYGGDSGSVGKYGFLPPPIEKDYGTNLNYIIYSGR